VAGPCGTGRYPGVYGIRVEVDQFQTAPETRSHGGWGHGRAVEERHTGDYSPREWGGYRTREDPVPIVDISPETAGSSDTIRFNRPRGARKNKSLYWSMHDIVFLLKFARPPLTCFSRRFTLTCFFYGGSLLPCLLCLHMCLRVSLSL